MNEVCTFSTVEDFWRYYNNIPRPSEIFYDGETRKKVGPEKKTIVGFGAPAKATTLMYEFGIEPLFRNSSK